MRNKVWYELLQARHSIEYCTLYCGFMRDCNKWFNAVVLVFSTSGIFGWAIWKSYPVIACILIAIMQLLKLILPNFIFSDKEFKQLDEIQEFYYSLALKLDKLWHELNTDKIDEDSATQQYYILKEQEQGVIRKLNELNIRNYHWLYKEATKRTHHYINTQLI